MPEVDCSAMYLVVRLHGPSAPLVAANRLVIGFLGSGLFAELHLVERESTLQS